MLTPRKQGDRGEFSAMAWLESRGPPIWIPLGHSPDADLLTVIDGRIVKVQVKTATYIHNGRFHVGLKTCGGNQSWSGVVKRFSAGRCDWLFVLVADGRRWFIPAEAVEGSTAILLGGPKYAEYEVDPGFPITLPEAA
jgi:PD-(D/E)XK nuclease superfamily protein